MGRGEIVLLETVRAASRGKVAQESIPPIIRAHLVGEEVEGSFVGNKIDQPVLWGDEQNGRRTLRVSKSCTGLP